MTSQLGVSSMSKQLVVVESPAKARTISRFLGSNSQVLASMGHVRDLPQHELGVDIQDDFRPSYELTNNGKKVLKALRGAAKEAEAIYLATDPDREGEAIAWHLKQILEDSSQVPFYRITFHEITKNAVRNSLQQPGEIAENLVEAQQARRILDRLVGYQISPLLWRQVGKGTSAGRVQSVALGLIVDREREIQAFEPQEYWNFEALFMTTEPKSKFKTKLSRINAEKALVPNEELAIRLEQALLSPGVQHQVAKVSSSPRRQNAAPPFITSTLQQAASSHLKLSTAQTMRLAQGLYEGVECGGEGPVGLITYMRTDSFNVAAEARQEAAEYIKKHFGPEYLPAKPNIYRSRKSAQEAHEAIRPTDIKRSPDSLSPYLSKQQLRLYSLIWNRFLASQMAPAKQLDHVIEIESSGGELATLTWQTDPDDKSKSLPVGTVCTFRAATRQTLFPGYLAVYSMKDLGEEDELDEIAGVLPALKEGQACELIELLKEQCFTAPPSRYSEASLVKALEQNGVGRPSTYAATIHTILDRDYVAKEKSLLAPTELGMRVSDFLVQKMPQLFNIGFTAEMEDSLDKIEDGTLDWVEMLKKFNEQLQEWLGAGAIPPESSIAMSDLEQLLQKLFPDDFAFKEPESKGRRTYDDRKFIHSIRTQISEKGKLSNRQWAALLNTLGKYEPEHPNFKPLLQEAGLLEQVKATMKAKEKKSAKKKTVTANPALLRLFEQMQAIEWEEPTKRGKRSYDDGKFFRSLYKQVKEDGSLSEAQTTVLARLTAKYAKQIPEYAELCAELGWEQPETRPVDTQQANKIERLLALSEQINAWREPSGKGKRTFDDREFVASLRNQYRLKGGLTERQIAALAKVLSNYAEQINDFAKEAQELGIVLKQAKQLDEKCPKCGAVLVERMGRGKPFVGCSAFPKCRYIASGKKKDK